MRLFTLFPNLITKESYNWWVTRRFWGFRQQISKVKYLKISQNIGGKYQEALGEHRSTVQNCLRNSPGRRYQRIRICPSGEVETLSFSIRRQNFEHEHSGGSARQPDINGGTHPGANGGSRVQLLSGYVVRMPSDGVSGRPVRVYSLHGFQRTLLHLILLW